MPGTPGTPKAKLSAYGSFGKTKTNKKSDKTNSDSGMSSENDDSLKYDLSATDVTISGDNPQVIKCLTSEPLRAEHGNEIPCCSNDFNVSVIVEEVGTSDEEKVSEYIVIDLTCDVNESKSNSRNCAVDCDNLCIDLDTSQSLVPVHNEMVRSDSQKLVSLSLSILLAALLQAMQCFAQFLEDIVVPQRQ